MSFSLSRPRKTGRRSRSLKSAGMESLEQRRLLSVSIINRVLTITGTTGNDTILV
ncbi:MAG: hypothetical protein QOE14_170, partial [Humisphaera sp.]|nr:hypothetical protein [Humisphaera sp.]